ncbi:AAA family ATPase [Clostridium sp. Ade.TY]|uniref:AAA family ATPase n=1 Tax=Clostridium sp. Ade.TY TaxID=1391647 RepID=UPI0004050FC0|nr:AAA family ATPase [Clostridium sp. Ade.TY]
MRPINLVISAFGPYAKEQQLDFEKLNGRNIFVITGTTGAGKTTIFDAISYALYGEASGESRENDSLRSHFADENTETFVELEFELKGDIYKIRRSPKQPKKKVRGNGFTEKDSEAILDLPNGKRIIGISNVNDKITQILGINKAQFKQIVMLPQGEFKKLLLASSVEREDIFRKIFNTYNFENIQADLKEKAIKISKERNSCKQKIEVHLDNIKGENNIEIGEYIDFPKVIEELTELIKSEKNIYKDKEDDDEKLNVEINKKRIEKSLLEQNNSLLIEKQNTEYKLNKLISMEAEIKSKKIISEKAKRAKEVSYVEKNYLEKRESLLKKEEDKKKSSLKINSLEDKLIVLEEAVKREESKEEFRNNLTEEIGRLRSLEPKIKLYEENKIKALGLEKDIVSIKEKIKLKEENIIASKEKKELNEKNIKEINEIEIKVVNLKNNVENKEKIIKELRDIFRIIDEYEKEVEEHNELKEKYLKVEKLYNNLKSEYDYMLDIYRKEQAGILADSLRNGEPCPVCGSKEHPMKAIKNSENVPTDEELKKKKLEYEKVEEKNNSMLLKLTSINSKIKGILDNINNSLNKLSERDADINNEYNEKTSKFEVTKLGKQLKSEIESLKEELKGYNEKIKLKEVIDKKIIELNKYLEDSGVELNSLREKDKNIYANIQSINATLSELKNDIPEDITSIDKLNELIKLKSYELEESKKRLLLSIKDRDENIRLVEGEKAKEKEIESNIVALRKDVLEIKNDFEKALKENNFNDEDEYYIAKSNIEIYSELDEEIEKFDKELLILKNEYKKLNKKCENIVFIDLKDINEKINELENIKKSKEKEIKDLYNIIENNKNVLSKVKDLNKELGKKEEEYKVIGELSDLANGKRSPYISFERYVLASYFQDIIDAANLRLEKMTGDRFSLKRKTTVSKGAGQKGLELEIYDNYTATSRDVSSLSGGESFKASLSLALGLSDVVQSSAGGVSLETMFVDEGFGTLDPQSLDNAIDSLLELQKGGRLVGIISHVQELKERVDAKIEVTSTKRGSIAEFNIL